MSRPGEESLIGDQGDFAFEEMIDDSYGSSTTFETMNDLLHEGFFPRCHWGPIYLKDSKSSFFCHSLDFVGLKEGSNGLRPSLRKRETMLHWPAPANYKEVEAFCHLRVFLRWFIPGCAELVRIMKYGKEEGSGQIEQEGEKKRSKRAVGECEWNREKEVAFQAIKQAIANNAMASLDSNGEYHLAVEASKSGIGGVLFQLEVVEAGTEAVSNSIHRVAEQLIMFILFHLSDTETRYSNSEREALAVIRCPAQVWCIVMVSKHLVMVYTDHEALKTLLTGLDNNAHGHIAMWQECLSEYDIKLLHRSAKVHFMGIADGLSMLPTPRLATHTAQDSEGLRPYMNGIVPVSGLVTDVLVNSTLAISLGTNYKVWAMESGEQDEVRERWAVNNMREGGEVFVGTSRLEEAGIGQAMGGKMGLEMRRAAGEMVRTRWEKWLKSGMYGTIVQARLDELEDGIIRAKQREMGRRERRVLKRDMRRYVMIDGREPGLFFREKNGELASCILEKDVRKVHNDLHEGHGYFASRITLGPAHGKVYWPSRANDIGRWVTSCESCQRVSNIQRAGQLQSIIQFKLMDMIGMDFVGAIKPPCQSTGFIYILIVVDYCSRFLWGEGAERADQTSTIKGLLTAVIPVVGWPLTSIQTMGATSWDL